VAQGPGWLLPSTGCACSPYVVQFLLKTYQKEYMAVSPTLNTSTDNLEKDTVVARALALGRLIRQPGALLALLSLVLGMLWAITIKPLDAPDEPAHLQAIMQVRKQHILPEVHYDTGKPIGNTIETSGDQAVREYAARVKNPYPLAPYESTQPPLYYVVAGVAALAFPADPPVVLYISRLVAVLFGAGTVYFCWKATREIAPNAPMWALAVAGMVALLPQFCFNSATASNDSAANLAGAAAFYIWFRGLRQKEYDPLLFKAGAIVGLAILAKLTSLALLPGLGTLIVLRAFNGVARPFRLGRYLRRGLSLGLGALAGMLAVCGWWLVRNIYVYGEASGMGGIFWSYIVNFTLLDWNSPRSRDLFLQYSWESIWGRFGWLDISLPPDFYRQAMYITIVFIGLSGLALALTFGRWITLRKAVVSLPSIQSVLTMVPVMVALLVGYIQFNLTIAYSAQGRYLFLGLLPMAMLFTIGVYALMPRRVLKILMFGALFTWLAWMNIAGLLVVGSARQ
jgi:4-amino-4-deoxy-L-arabinose transferase-like glycosyltransferase